MKNTKENKDSQCETSLILFSSALIGISLLSGAILASSATSADVVDDVTITVPVSCNMTSELDEAHTATINPGQYQSDIGTTNFTVFCNDNSGYAIYAIGYSNEEYGNTKMLATINSQLYPTYDINTGTNTSGANSSWSMKLIPVTGTYAPTIENGFANYHIVPEEYTKVATFASNTDFTIGSSLQSTYQVYIDGNKPAGTYNGKVKYTLVHPNDGTPPLSSNKIGVTYNANGSSFDGGATTNEMIYAMNPMYEGATTTISKSANVSNNGTQNGAYYTGEEISTLDPITLTGADKIKVVLRYGLTADSGEVLVVEGNWDGNSDITGNYYEFYSDSDNLSGTNTYVFNGDTITIAMWGWNTPVSGYDYGYYAEIYPIYEAEEPNTTASTDFYVASIDSGTYTTTTDWYGSWYADINGTHYDFMDEAEVKSFLEDNASALSGTTVNLMRGLTINEAYAKVGKTQVGGYYIQQNMNKSVCQTIAIGQNGTVKDIRDGNVYMIGKLKDGNCWMLNNLALDPTNPTTAANMNENNTNATAAAINNLLHGGNSTVGWSNTPVADVDKNFNSYTKPLINNTYRNTLTPSYGPAAENGRAKNGLYYNYCAASASTYCYESSQGVDVPNTNMDTLQDICPANWRMPTGGKNGEYSVLYSKYNATMDAASTDSLQYNLSTTELGRFHDYWPAGNGGSWWSSTYYDDNNMYVLSTSSTNVYADHSSTFRDYGPTIRCLVSGNNNYDYDDEVIDDPPIEIEK